MSVVLDYADIQGNILLPYGKQGFPAGRNILLHVDDAAGGRNFVTGLLPFITTALLWSDSTRRASGKTAGERAERPKVAVNIAFTFAGLLNLGVPIRTLQGLPEAFIDGMTFRAPILGDDFGFADGQDFREGWDKVWRRDPFNGGHLPGKDCIDILITLNVAPNGGERLKEVTDKIESLAASNHVRVLEGHDPDGRQRYQELSALRDKDGRYVPNEHFGFHDGIGDPVFEGQYLNAAGELDATGNGAVDGDGKWRPIATGEFLLGYPDEAQETSGIMMPLSFARNGTFLAYRKLKQRVKKWNDFIDEKAKEFAIVFGIPNHDDAKQTLMAKMAGRWTDGVPVSAASTADEWRAFNRTYPEGSPERDKALVNFRYFEDPRGERCPMGSHLRRVNTRDSLDPQAVYYEQLKNAKKPTDPPPPLDGSVLNNRRRLLRRGLPFGDNPHDLKDDSGERGVVMYFLCADLFRQFEFVQQQWINYGLDARSGNDTCPIVGNHVEQPTPGGPALAKFVIPVPEGSGHPPFIVDSIPQFVEMRGGGYFFVPSMTALRMIGMGTIDPT